ncbi:MAG: alkaline phosphatase [Clostridia bacterium]|nr:alkaline phosphatase [Clostridia bacterium]
MKTKKALSLLLALVLALSVLIPLSALAASGGKQYKNVIFMIGDGMGENHLKLAEAYGYDLFMDEYYDCRGQSKTRSFSNAVTDSAAGATALSCGVRNTNSCVATYWYDPSGTFFRPKNITENAMDHGMRTGVVTTDSTAGATPAGYSSYARSRNMDDVITERQLASGIDLIWGGAVDCVTRTDVEKLGITYVSSKTEMEALTPGTRSFGQLGGSFWRPSLPEESGLPTLREMTEKAISLLDCRAGFFLMVEGAHIDKNSHASDEGVDYPEKRERAAAAVKAFDDAVKAAVEFAKQDGHTIVIVTADHETGDLYMENGAYHYHSGSHTGANVPLIVFCCDDFVKDGQAVKNCDIPVILSEKLGWSKTEFPKMMPGSFLEKIRNLFRKF